MLRRNRLQSIGWASVLVIAFALFGALTLKVNSVKSQVRQAERRIVALQQEQTMLETEFETRASQQQLASWNLVEFGYRAPDAGQFIEGERQLAVFGTPRGPGAPDPIEVASAGEVETGEAFPQLVSPLTGKAFVAKAERSTVALDRLPERAARIALSVRAGVSE